MVAQPKRSAEDIARFASVDAALTSAKGKGGTAKTAKEACAELPDLLDKLGALNLATPPKGLEQEFAEQRDGVIMQVDVLLHQTCDDPGLTPMPIG